MLTIDDTYRLQDFGLIPLQEHINPLTPEIERKTMHIPGKSGLWDFGVETRGKYFSLPVGIIEYEKYEKQRKLSDFVAFLFDPFGKPKEFKLVFDYEPDKFYLVKLAEMLDVSRLVNAAQFELPLVANYPYKQFVAQSDEITWESKVIPIYADITWLYGVDDFEIKAPQTIEVRNDGSLIAKPKILINGSATSLTLTLNGESFSFGAINKPIEIDVSKYTLKINGVESLSAMTGKLDKFYLLPGVNKIGIAGSGLNLIMTFEFYNEYI